MLTLQTPDQQSDLHSSSLMFKYYLDFDDLLNEILAYLLPRNRAVGVTVSFCQLDTAKSMMTD